MRVLGLWQSTGGCTTLLCPCWFMLRCPFLLGCSSSLGLQGRQFPSPQGGGSWSWFLPKLLIQSEHRQQPPIPGAQLASSALPRVVAAREQSPPVPVLAQGTQLKLLQLHFGARVCSAPRQAVWGQLVRSEVW